MDKIDGSEQSSGLPTLTLIWELIGCFVLAPILSGGALLFARLL